MSSVVQLFDAAGRRRSPATLSDFHAGRAPGNLGQRYAADPPTVDEIIAVMRHAADARYGNRVNGLIVVLWRAGLRINEALSLIETDLEERRGSILVRHGLCRIRHRVCYAEFLLVPSRCGHCCIRRAVGLGMLGIIRRLRRERDGSGARGLAIEWE